MNTLSSPRRDWGNTLLLTLVHVAAVVGLAVYLPLHGLSWAAAAIGFSLTVVTIFCISAGYHRLFSHRTYEAHPAFRLFLLVFGAGAFQNSVLAWAADHRRHHGKTDSDHDPYNAQAGFWYSHIGWVLRKADPNIPRSSTSDLEQDPLVVWQHRRYAWIGIAAGLVFPTLLGLAFGDPLGGFVIGAAVRLLVCYHATFAINSLAHRLGAQPYSDRSSARDSFWVALVSMGEGYHNFHHAFPSDFRNGVRRYHYDPTKWILSGLAAVGVVRNLKRTSQATIVRARVRVDERRLAGRVVSAAGQERMLALRATIDRAVDRFHGLVAQSRADRRAAQRDLQVAYAAWRQLIRSPGFAT